jgi:hypothetical protein
LQRLMLRSGTHDDSERGDGGWGIAAGRVTECCEQVPVSEMLCATASCFSENRLSQADPGHSPLQCRRARWIPTRSVAWSSDRSFSRSAA